MSVELGTAATQDSSAFATAAQGILADSAVQLVIAGANITVDNTDSRHPIVSAAVLTSIASVQAGANVTVDVTSPANPIVNAYIRSMSMPVATGTANAVVVTNAVPIPSLGNGDIQFFIPSANNTNATTFSVDGTTAEPVFANGAALVANMIVAGAAAGVIYNNAHTRWDLINPATIKIVSTPTATGTANALIITNTNAIPAFVNGVFQAVIPAAPNTGPATANADGLGVKNIFVNGAALIGGEMQTGVPAELLADGTQWNLINPALPGKNFMVDPCSRVAQGAAAALVNNTYAYGAVDLVQCKGSGTALTAGTATQDTAGTIATASTAYSCKIAGLTVTGTGKAFFRRWIESRDAVALKNRTTLIGVLCRHDVGSNVNAFLTVNHFQTQDVPGTPVLLATGSTVSVASGTDTFVGVVVNGDTSNGIEIILEMDCGAVTTKNFYVTDWQAALGTLAQKCVVPRFEDDYQAAMRYFEKSYEYGTAPGTNTQNGEILFYIGSSAANGSGIGVFQMRVMKVVTPTVKPYSTAGTVNKISVSAADTAVTTTPYQNAFYLVNNSGGSIADGAAVGIHFTADARF